ncbi:MAG TPA: DUF3857 domain-containing protein [Ferruginibacter sp.]|nr:DUF3857 domain-containing protein [Ferruginibacter sp.]
MKKFLTLFFLGFTSTMVAQQSNYEMAWKALSENKRSEAASLLSAAEKEPASFPDAYISKIYLATYNGKEKGITDFNTAFYSVVDNPYPYIYALWLNQAVMGPTGKKAADHQVKLAELLIKDEKAPGTLVGSANYQKGMHMLFSNEFEKAQLYYDAIGNIRNWQYTGPFENLSESGFYKNYGPPDHAEPNAVFTSLTNAPVKWITPTAEIKDGWTPVCYQFNNQTAVVYAQNFISSESDQKVLCNIGASGSVKVWINDELLISESTERVTEMDTYSVECELKKGTNRVLIQLGFSNSTYPNFNLRFTDNRLRPIPNIKGSATYAAYPKVNSPAKQLKTILPFAETFFTDRISKQPSNLVNYLLLADVYLRNKKVIEARNILTKAMEQAPGNCLLKMKMAEVLIKESNRTLLLEELEKIKQADPESLVVLDIDIKEMYDNQKYEDMEVALRKRISLFGEDETTTGYKILLLVQEKKYEEMMKEAEKAYEKYPENAKIVEMMYSIKKEVYKDHKAALKVYETYMKHNFDYGVYETYAGILADQSSKEKALDARKKLVDALPYYPNGYYNLSKYHYTVKQYDQAETFVQKALSIAPYNENFWEQLGDIYSEKQNKASAMDAYNQSLKYDPNQYSILNKIRKLNGQSELYKSIPQVDVARLIKDDVLAEAKNTDYGYYYILDQKDVILYPGGANEEYYTVIIRITNEKGVDQYKESTLGYNNNQNILVEKAEVIKKNQSKIEGERNGSQVVFTNLEAGDILVFKYRLQRFAYGRFANEYWDKYYFGSQIYASTTRYNLLVPAGQPVSYVFSNAKVTPVIKDVENFKWYSWEMNKITPLKNEPLMPVYADISEVLHVSTIPSWNDIASWYSDVCNNKAEEDFEIIALYKKLFPDPEKKMTQYQKARVIYDYIQSNIRYSSVSFRQSAYVPQRASATLTTRLGDCKDLSSLFVTLAHMAGINAQMVLVDTRGNGQKDIILPGIEFNHCIAKAQLDDKNYYIELTDNYLPFTSLPNNLIGSIILEIPSKRVSGKSDLQLLVSDHRSRDMVKRVMDIKPVGIDLQVQVKVSKFGNLSSGIRNTYINLDNDKQVQEMEKTVASGYKNNIKLDQLSFTGLDQVNDSISYTYQLKVKNEVSEIGSLNTFRVTYPDVVASLDNFTSDERSYPVEYWTYEDGDLYETIVNITAPAGKKFVELPTSENLQFKDMNFSIKYTLKSPGKLMITRRYSCKRQNISPADYPAFKSFFEKIVRAEQKFIAYK